MKRALIIAGVLALAAGPAFAASSWTVEKDTYSSTSSTSVVPESGSTVSTTIIAPAAPPPPRAEVPPPPPGPGVAWVPGHWMWQPGTAAYAWINGRYAQPPRVGVAWEPGHWARRPSGWMWLEGHWD